MLELLINLGSSVGELFHLSSQILSLSTRICSMCVVIMMNLLVLTALLVVVMWFLLRFCAMNLPRQGEPGFVHVAFFHPYCNAGGGGERVLWCAIRAIQKKYSKVKCYIYTGDIDATPEEILQRAQQRFNVVLPRNVEFIYLQTRTVIEAKHYPFLTLLMQSLASIILGAEALGKFRPNVYIDTMGYAFTYPLFRYVAGCTVGSYTHYPTISTDMLGRVANRVEAHNNQGFIARSPVLSTIKLGYYHIFALIYSLVGRCAHVVMVNSSWTHGHISALWGPQTNLNIVYPPCDTQKFKSLDSIPDKDKDLKTIVSIGQFRPEKDHSLQLRAFKHLCNIIDTDLAKKTRLVLIGGCRDEEDNQRVEALKVLSEQLGISDQIIWKLNCPFPQLLESVQNGLIGLHTMWNEHFGICVVECMAGGLIMLAHDSAGPKMDIITEYDNQQTGYLATDEESYAQAMKTILEASDEERDCIRTAAKTSVDRFSDEVFEVAFMEAIGGCIQIEDDDVGDEWEVIHQE